MVAKPGLDVAADPRRAEPPEADAAAADTPLIAAPPAEAEAWPHRHLLDCDVLQRTEIERILDTTDAMTEVLGRSVPRTPALRGVTIVNLFYEASTRTRASFELAGKALGADVINVAGSGSSVEKGESLVDTIRTLEAVGADLIVLRHAAAGAPYLAAQHSAAALINGGDGAHAHPTQALLDAYTLRRHLGDLAGRRVCIVGDLLHSRVARSNLWTLTALGARVTLVAPRTLLPRALNAEHPLALPNVDVTDDLDAALPGADAVMALRIQRERMQGALLPSFAEYARRYQINAERLARASQDVLVLHPGPINEGVEIAPDVAHGARSLIEEQVQAGVAVRMAVLYLLARSTDA